MRTRKVAGGILLAAGVVGIAAGALGYVRPGTESRAFAARRADAEARMDSTRAELSETSLRYQGYEKSTSSLPDSVRMFGAGIVMKEGQTYQKKLFILEARKRDIRLDIARLKRKEAEARASDRKSAIPIAGAGLLAALAGAAILRRPRP